MFRCLGMLVLLLPALAFGKVFKCEGDDGRITFSHVPCPSGSGVATAVKVTPANSIQAHGAPVRNLDGIGLESDDSERGRDKELVVVGQSDDLGNKIRFQIDWIYSRANRESDIGQVSALRSAAHALERAPVDQETLALARETVTAIDRGQSHKAAVIARQAAQRSAERGELRERRRDGSNGVSMPVPVAGPPPTPSVITNCDAGGCWDDKGGRYNKGAGATYFPAAGGPACQMEHGRMSCP